MLSRGRVIPPAESPSTFRSSIPLFTHTIMESTEHTEERKGSKFNIAGA